jgi:hypothetical protein
MRASASVNGSDDWHCRAAPGGAMIEMAFIHPELSPVVGAELSRFPHLSTPASGPYHEVEETMT